MATALARLRLHALVLGSYAVFAVLMFWPAWRHPLTSMVGSYTDSGLIVWFLGWDANAMLHGHGLLTTTWLNAPYGVNLMWNTSMILPGLLFAPLTRLGSPVLTFNVLMTLAPVLSAWCAFVLFRRWSSTRAAYVGALLYGYSPYMFAQSHAHLQLTLALFPPIALLLLHEIVVVQDRSHALMGAALGVLTAAQILTGEEVVALTAITAATALVVLLVMSPRAVRARARHAAIALAVAAGVVIGTCAYPLGVQFFGTAHVHGAVNQPANYGNDFVSFVVPTPASWFGGGRFAPVASKFAGNPTEWNGYVGLPLLLVLLVLVVRRWHDMQVRLAAVTGVVLAVLSLGYVLRVGGIATHVSLPAARLDSLPLVRNLIPNRLMLGGFLMCGLLLAKFIDVAATRIGLWPATLTAVGLLLPLVPSAAVPAQHVSTPKFFSDCQRGLTPGASLLVAPWPSSADSSAMVWQAMGDMPFKMVGGYAIVPDANGQATFSRASVTKEILTKIESGEETTVPQQSIPAIRSELRSWHLAGVVVGPMPHREIAVDLFDRAFGPGRDICGAELWTGV